MFERVRSRIQAASRYSSDRWLYAWGLGYAAVGAGSLLVPLYAITLGAGPFVVGLIESLAGLAGIPGALIWGRLADRTGQRRTFVTISLFGTAAVLAVFPFIDTPTSVVVLNGILWFMVAAASPVVTVFMLENQTRSAWDRRIGLLNAYQRYGWVGGLLGGTLWLGTIARLQSTVQAQRSLFILCAGAAGLAVPLVFLWLPAKATTSAKRLTRTSHVGRIVASSGRYVKLIPYVPSRAVGSIASVDARRLLGRLTPDLRRYLLISLVFYIGFAIFFGPLPVYLTVEGLSSSTIFGLFIVSSLASAVIFVPVGRWSTVRGPKWLQTRALSIRALLFPAIGLLGLIASLALRVIGFGIGFALIGFTWAIIAVTGAGLVSRIAPERIRGEALGIYTAVAGLGGGVGGILGGMLARVFTYQATFGVAGVTVLLSILLLMVWSPPVDDADRSDPFTLEVESNE